MLLYSLFIAQLFYQPLPSSVGVGHGLLGGKGFGGDDKQGGLGVDLPECFGYVRAVNIGNKMGRNLLQPVRPEGLGNHSRPQVGAANAYIDHVPDGFAGIAAQLLPVHLAAKGGHLIEHAVYVRHHIVAVNFNTIVPFAT